MKVIAILSLFILSTACFSQTDKLEKLYILLKESEPLQLNYGFGAGYVLDNSNYELSNFISELDDSLRLEFLVQIVSTNCSHVDWNAMIFLRFYYSGNRNENIPYRAKNEKRWREFYKDCELEYWKEKLLENRG